MLYKTVDVFNCARCGETHEQLRFKLFIEPIRDSDGTEWQYWTICPKTNEPILLKVMEK